MGAQYNPAGQNIRVLAADESRTSTTTQAPLTGLTFSAPANTTWLVESLLKYTSAGAAGGVDATISLPSGATFTGTNSFFYHNQADISYIVSSPQIQRTGDFTNGGATLTRGVIKVTTAGAITVTAAQFSSNATPTVYKAGSFTSLTQVV